jgi:hypothetical protein
MITGLIKRKIIGAIVIVPRSFPGADTIAISAQTLIVISARVQAPTNVSATTAPGKEAMCLSLRVGINVRTLR